MTPSNVDDVIETPPMSSFEDATGIKLDYYHKMSVINEYSVLRAMVARNDRQRQVEQQYGRSKRL
jgi:hypothetical protein